VSAVEFDRWAWLGLMTKREPTQPVNFDRLFPGGRALIFGYGPCCRWPRRTDPYDDSTGVPVWALKGISECEYWSKPRRPQPPQHSTVAY
jgi:hypothetical protein